MRLRFVASSLALALAVALLATSAARAEDAVPLDCRLTRVTAWKNGVALFTRECRTPKRPGTYSLPLEATIVHGSVWVGAPRGTVVESLASRVAPAGAPAVTSGALACAAMGREVVLGRADGAPVKGRLLHAPCAQRSAMDPWQAGVGSTWVQVATADGLVTLPLSTITSLEIPGLSEPLQETGRQLDVTLSQVEGSDFTISWLARGFTWAPAARIELGEGTEATLSSSVTLVNEAEALDGVDVDVITGPATIAMGNVPSPLVAGLSEFMAALLGRGTGYDVSQVPLQNARERGGGGPAADSGVADPDAVEDVTVRTLSDVTLARGASAWLPAWSERVSVEHVYLWTARAESELQRERERYSSGAPPRASGPVHALRVENATGTAWTTQPIVIVSKGTVVGQSRMSYTPAGGTAEIDVAEALDLVSSANEVEVSRVSDSVLGSRRERASRKGDLAVRNLTGGAVRLEVRRIVEGRLTGSEPPAATTALASPQPYNPRQQLSWTITLGSGEEARWTYSYDTWL